MYCIIFIPHTHIWHDQGLGADLFHFRAIFQNVWRHFGASSSPPIYWLELPRGQARIQPAVISRNFPKWCTDICVIISFKSCLLIHIFSLSKKLKTQAIGSYTEKIKYLKRRNQIQKTKQNPCLHFTVTASWHYLYVWPSPGKAFQAVGIFIACIFMCQISGERSQLKLSSSSFTESFHLRPARERLGLPLGDLEPVQCLLKRSKRCSPIAIHTI